MSTDRPTIPDVLRQLAPLLNALPASLACLHSIFCPLPPSALPSDCPTGSSAPSAAGSTPPRSSNRSTAPLPSSSPSRSRPSPTTGSASSPSLPSSPSSQSIIVRTPTGAWYCSACKKSFASQATCTAHEQSGKHKDAVKRLSKAPAAATTSKHGRPLSSSSPALRSGEPGSTSTRSAASATAGAGSQAPSSAELGDVLAKLKKVKSIEATNPLLAVTVYWNIAQALWAQFADPRDSALALSLLLAHMHRSGDSIAAAATTATGGAGGDNGALPYPPAQLGMHAALALARLLTVAALACVPGRDRPGMESIVGKLALAIVPMADAHATANGDMHERPADWVMRVQQAWTGGVWDSQSVREVCAWIDAWADAGTLGAQVRVARWAVALTDQARNEAAQSIIDYHVVRGLHVQTIWWARFLIPRLAEAPKATSRELVAAEAAIAALLIKDKVAMHHIVHELCPELAQTVELKFASHLLDKNMAPSTWAMQSARLALQVQLAIAAAKQLPKGSQSTVTNSLCVRLAECGEWGFARVARWESVMQACVNEERICGMV